MAGCLLQATVLSDMTACCSWPQHEDIHHQQFTTSQQAICIAISAYVPKQFDYHSASAQLSMCQATTLAGPGYSFAELACIWTEAQPVVYLQSVAHVEPWVA